VTGERKREFFTTIRKTIRDINDSFEKLDVTELVPLPDSDETVSYKALIGHELDKIPAVYIGEERKSYPVRRLLDGVVSYEERKQEEDYLRIAHKEGRDVHLHVHQNVAQFVAQKSEQNVNIQLDLKVDLPDMQDSFSNFKRALMKADLTDPELAGELKEIQEHLESLTLKAGEEEMVKPMNKLGSFLRNLGDEDSTLRKIVNGTEKGIALAQKVGKTYNKFAQWLALPQVPEALLGEKKSEP
jgi:hypothetical protein